MIKKNQYYARTLKSLSQLRLNGYFETYQPTCTKIRLMHTNM